MNQARRIQQTIPADGWSARFRNPNGGKAIRSLICWAEYVDGRENGAGLKLEGIALCRPCRKAASLERPNDEAMQICGLTSQEQAAEHIEYVRSRYADGESLDDIALEYKTTGEALRCRLKDYDLVEYRKTKEARVNKREGKLQPTFAAGWCDLEPTFICYVEPNRPIEAAK